MKSEDNCESNEFYGVFADGTARATELGNRKSRPKIYRYAGKQYI